MPAAAKRSKPSAAKSIAAHVDAIQAAAIQKWRSWVFDVAAGRAVPDAAAVLEAASIIGLPDAGRTFDQDVGVVRELQAAEARVARDRAALEESVAPFGGDAGLAQEIERRRDELKQLEALASPWRYLSVGHTQGHVDRVRRGNPRLWDA